MDLDTPKKNKLPWVSIRKEWFFPTKEDWEENYINDTVMVRMSEGWHPLRPYVYNLHLTLWGTGDFGMHKWFKADILTLDHQRRRIVQLVNSIPHPVEIDWLKKNGFRFC